MMRFILIICLIIPAFSFAQKSVVKGSIKDRVNNETVPTAIVKLNDEFKMQSDFDGNYEFVDVPYGKYNLTVSFSDYDTVVIKLVVDKPTIIQDVKIGGSAELEEIRIIGNISTDRKTPIAITKISAAKIQEELGSRDLPMLLNGTPGVYATQQGGGDGDARITVRGFDQRNIGVLIDGVPVNDMENGAVYWSNWFGLDNITNQIQLQRGLGATKLSMPSVGGSMNIITQGIGGRKGITFKQEFATGNFLRTSLSYNSGLLKNGFGVTLSGSYKQGDGWVEGLNTQGEFYYAKVQKKWDKHLLSLSAFGAPQKHGQRSFNQKIQYWDAQTARDLGAPVDTTQFYDRGIRFNQHYGYITEDGKKVVKNERLNYYHKPQITLKDFWTVNKKMSISNIGYMSIGRGGGTAMSNSGAVLYTTDGHIDWDAIVKANREDQIFGGPSVDPQYSPTELKSTQVQIANVNNHFWVGYLGQFNYEYTKNLVFSGGVDYRYYKGTHYQYIKDILGGDYYINGQNKNEANLMKREGDKIGLNTYNNYRDGLVQWGGVFGTAEYSSTRWTAFLNVSGVVNAYKGIDYFQKKWLELGDTTLRIGANDTVSYNGQTYTANSPGLVNNHTEWKTIPGATIKAGANYTLNEESSVFVNLGYLSRTPQFSNVIDNNTNTFFKEIKNEIIQAVELGYAFANKRFGVNVNGYFTNWKNKPFPYGVSIPNPQDPTSNIYLNINGMDAIHKGGEIDIAYKISKKLSADFMFSMGDWRWNSSDTLFIPDYNYKFSFDAKGVHVGNAAQTMLSSSIRYEPIKNLYVKLQYQWFDRFYADFNPFSLQGANGRKDSWKIPSYGLVNLFAGYSHKFEKFNMFFNGTVTNLLGSAYIADATNNFYAPNSFDSQSASVMFGQGFRFDVSLGVQF
jgi:hypothetical protein